MVDVNKILYLFNLYFVQCLRNKIFDKKTNVSYIRFPTQVYLLNDEIQYENIKVYI